MKIASTYKLDIVSPRKLNDWSKNIYESDYVDIVKQVNYESIIIYTKFIRTWIYGKKKEYECIHFFSSFDCFFGCGCLTND